MKVDQWFNKAVDQSKEMKDMRATNGKVREYFNVK